MNGVIVRGMEMPQTCKDCNIDVNFCTLWEEFEGRHERRHDDCPLIPWEDKEADYEGRCWKKKI